jgi:hypothetical protein
MAHAKIGCNNWGGCDGQESRIEAEIQKGPDKVQGQIENKAGSKVEGEKARRTSASA